MDICFAFQGTYHFKIELVKDIGILNYSCSTSMCGMVTMRQEEDLVIRLGGETPDQHKNSCWNRMKRVSKKSTQTEKHCIKEMGKVS